MAQQPELELIDGNQLLVVWPDEAPLLLSTQLIRRGCTCAACEKKRAKGELLLPSGAVAQITKILRFEHVGGYAARFTFSDRHRGGLYSWELLRALAQDAASQQ